MRDTTVYKVLREVEDLAPDACGALMVEIDGDCVGSVFVERKQVCWAAYAGLRRRLRDLLREHLARALSDADLERTYHESAIEGVPFGEKLVSRQYVKADAMRKALRQHTIESLLALPQAQGESLDWVPHRYQGYQPRFTFTPAELLVAVNSVLYEAEAAGAELALSLLEVDVCGASFVQCDDGGLVAIRARGPWMTIVDLDELGSWAEAAFAVTRGFPHEVMKRAIEAASGEVWVAWQTSRLHTHAATLHSRAALERLVGMLQTRGFRIVISRRAPASPLTVRDGLGTVDSNP